MCNWEVLANKLTNYQNNLTSCILEVMTNKLTNF